MATDAFVVILAYDASISATTPQIDTTPLHPAVVSSHVDLGILFKKCPGQDAVACIQNPVMGLAFKDPVRVAAGMRGHTPLCGRLAGLGWNCTSIRTPRCPSLIVFSMVIHGNAIN
ncbi:hypothetical protein ACMYSQ_008980 [Aspergillus niger]